MDHCLFAGEGRNAQQAAQPFGGSQAWAATGAEDKGHWGSLGEATCRAQMEMAKNGKQQAGAGRQGEAEIGGGSE